MQEHIKRLEDENHALKTELRRKDDLRWEKVERGLAQISGLRSAVDSLTTAINGTEAEPAKGFKVRVDRLEQTEKDRSWFNRVVTVSVVGLVIKAIWSAIKGQ